MNGAQGFLNPNNETLRLDTTIEGTHKPMQPSFVIAMNHKRVAWHEAMLSPNCCCWSQIQPFASTWTLS